MLCLLTNAVPSEWRLPVKENGVMEEELKVRSGRRRLETYVHRFLAHPHFQRVVIVDGQLAARSLPLTNTMPGCTPPSWQAVSAPR